MVVRCLNGLVLGRSYGFQRFRNVDVAADRFADRDGDRPDFGDLVSRGRPRKVERLPNQHPAGSGLWLFGWSDRGSGLPISGVPDSCLVSLGAVAGKWGTPLFDLSRFPGLGNAELAEETPEVISLYKSIGFIYWTSLRTIVVNQLTYPHAVNY